MIIEHPKRLDRPACMPSHLVNWKKALYGSHQASSINYYSISTASSSTGGRWVMQIMKKAGMAWRVWQTHNKHRFKTSNASSNQGDKITNMEKANQNSGEGKKTEASSERVRGAEKCPALKWSGSTLRGSLTEVKRKRRVAMARDRHAITNISLLKLWSWAQGFPRMSSGGTTYLKSTKKRILLCSPEINDFWEKRCGLNLINGISIEQLGVYL